MSEPRGADPEWPHGSTTLVDLSGVAVHHCRVSQLSIPAFKLVPQPLSEEAESLLVRPARVDPSIGDRHRLGGTPDRLNDRPIPACKTCGEAMTSYAQLDSLPAGDFDLADAGLIHVWVCFDCFDVTAMLDSV